MAFFFLMDEISHHKFICLTFGFRGGNDCMISVFYIKVIYTRKLSLRAGYHLHFYYNIHITFHFFKKNITYDPYAIKLCHSLI